MKTLARLIVILIGIPILLFIGSFLYVGTKQTMRDAEVRVAASSGQPLADGGWHYSGETDQLTGKTERFACIKSTNSLEFGFPYNGGSRAELCFRDSGRRGHNAILTIKGQIPCFDGCPIKMRIDEGKVVTVSGTGAADNSTGVVFLPYLPTLSAVKRAKRLRIEAQFYQEGDRVMEFAPAGLQWK
jgi:hypothetical protein